VSDLLEGTIEVFAGTAAEKSISPWAGSPTFLQSIDDSLSTNLHRPIVSKVV
jgi:hypothetical protein